jgi:hypothetical protein
MVALAAKDRVLETPEILEGILLKLPIRDLLVTAERVSKEWHIIIQSSPAIQEILFFRPRSRKSDEEQSFNPLLQASFAPWFKNHDETSTRWGSGLSFHDLDWNSSDFKRHAYARKDASWRKMLPVQPAVKQLDVVSRRHAMGGDRECCGESHFKDGVRMGTLYDMAQDHVKRPITRVGVKWVIEENSGFLSVLSNSLGLGKEKCRVVMTINHTVQCCDDVPDQLGPEFKSLGYEEVKVEMGPIKYMPFR